MNAYWHSKTPKEREDGAKRMKASGLTYPKIAEWMGMGHSWVKNVLRPKKR